MTTISLILKNLDNPFFLKLNELDLELNNIDDDLKIHKNELKKICGSYNSILELLKNYNSFLNNENEYFKLIEKLTTYMKDIKNKDKIIDDLQTKKKDILDNIESIYKETSIKSLIDEIINNITENHFVKESTCIICYKLNPIILPHNNCLYSLKNSEKCYPGPICIYCIKDMIRYCWENKYHINCVLCRKPTFYKNYHELFSYNYIINNLIDNYIIKENSYFERYFKKKLKIFNCKCDESFMTLKELYNHEINECKLSLIICDNCNTLQNKTTFKNNICYDCYSNIPHNSSDDELPPLVLSQRINSNTWINSGPPDW